MIERATLFLPPEAVIAMTHIDIAAPAFCIGTCWAGFVIMAMEDYGPLKQLVPCYLDIKDMK